VKYLLLEPETVEAAEAWPLIVFLHGSGERGADLTVVERYGLPRFVAEQGPLPAFILVPQCPRESEWSDLTSSLQRTLNHVLTSDPIARDRVSLTGFSMGATGGWEWVVRHPDTFAAFAPVAGSPGGLGGELDDARVDAIRGLPIWMFHGAKDEEVPVTGADGAAELLQELNSQFRYTRYPDAGHGETCRKAYCDRSLHDWLHTATNPRP